MPAARAFAPNSGENGRKGRGKGLSPERGNGRLSVLQSLRPRLQVKLPAQLSCCSLNFSPPTPWGRGVTPPR